MKIKQLEETTRYLISKGFTKPNVGIVLGTGLHQLINEVDIEQEIAYADIPHFPKATVEFHSGRLVYGTLSGKKVVIMSGRFHLYEGYDHWEVTYGVRALTP